MFQSVNVSAVPFPADVPVCGRGQHRSLSEVIAGVVYLIRLGGGAGGIGLHDTPLQHDEHAAARISRLEDHRVCS